MTTEHRKQQIREAGRKYRQSEKGKQQIREKNKKWRQTEQGIFMRNKSHWIEAGMREPEEGWETFYHNTFKITNNCQLCNIEFNKDKRCCNTQRILDHDHHSGYIRFICCRKCNTSCIKKYDNKRLYLICELNRYFKLK